MLTCICEKLIYINGTWVVKVIVQFFLIQLLPSKIDSSQNFYMLIIQCMHEFDTF